MENAIYRFSCDGRLMLNVEDDDEPALFFPLLEDHKMVDEVAALHGPFSALNEFQNGS